MMQGDEMNKSARGALIIWHDMPEEQRDEMLAWYNSEHHAERVDIEGFHGVRRYHAVEADHQLFIHYETSGPEVLSSESYLARVNAPTAWSLKCQRLIRNNSRTVCALESRHGTARGGFVVTHALRGTVDEERAQSFAAQRKAAGQVPGFLAWEAFRADNGASALPSAEKSLRGKADDHIAGLHVFHVMDLGSARAVRDTLLQVPALLGTETGIFQLAFSLSPSER
ncbi:MAG: hypothetical protein IBJ07_14690 [Rhizobiaceae bacterium]|nr:hypothetical protein [Rhizobiaceae bacterium]